MSDVSRPPTLITICRDGVPAAWASRERVWTAAWASQLAFDELRRLHLKCVIAGAVLRGELPGRWDDGVAEELVDVLLASGDLLSSQDV